MIVQNDTKVWHYIAILLVIWTGLAAASFWWNLNHQKEEIFKTAGIQARLTLEKDLLYRQWAISHGGVYVPITEKTQPNPYLYLPNRDVTTSAGQKLTLVNPAYMTRQVNEMAARAKGSYGRLSSLNPLRYGNSPDPWEKKSLEAFKTGIKEMSAIEKIADEDHMRLMRPYVAEESCLKCHRWQGYKAGDIMGGISVSIAMKPFYALLQENRVRLALTHGVVWLFFTVAVLLGGIRLHAAQDRLIVSENNFRELFDNMKSGVAVYEAKEDGNDFIIKDLNYAAQSIEQIARQDVIGKSVLQVFPGVREFGLFEVFQRVLKDGLPRYHPVSRYKDDRIEGWRENYIYRLPTGDIVAIYDDVTEMKKKEEEIRMLVVTDPLTGLYNRRGFMALAEQQMKAANRTGKILSLLFIDLDGMKFINDTWGHEEGDKALVAAATILKQTFRESDILARIGGDEFAVMAVDAAETPEIIIGRLQKNIASRNAASDNRYEIAMSIGVAVYDPQTPLSLDELVSKADTLMYEQKKIKANKSSAQPSS